MIITSLTICCLSWVSLYVNMIMLCWWEIWTSLLRIRTLKFLWVHVIWNAWLEKPTRFESAHPNFIDLILTNKILFFKNCNVLEVRISDHHNFTDAVLKSQLIKGNAKIKKFRDYISFQMEHLRQSWIRILKVTLALSILNLKRHSLAFSINMFH